MNTERETMIVSRFSKNTLPKGGSKRSVEQVQAHVMFHIGGLGGSLQLLQFFSRLKKYTVSKCSSVHEIIMICCCHFVFQTSQ